MPICDKRRGDGVGSAACAAVLHRRRAAGADLSEEYLSMARGRVALAQHGHLPRRPLGKQVYIPGPNDKIAKPSAELNPQNGDSLPLFSGGPA